MAKPFRETKCGSAVLTALQIKQIPIVEFSNVVTGCKVRAFLNGADLTKWIDILWHNVGLVLAAEAAMRVKARGTENEIHGNFEIKTNVG